ncbi:hypothetical protein Hdeb2414_s0018g00514941 [Helianthus debilis subsp. tardiflorus]
MVKGPIYGRRVKEGGAALPAAIGCQLSDQGEYPLGLLCCGQGGGTRGAPIFAHAGDVVPLLSVCSLDLLQVHMALGDWWYVLSFLSEGSSFDATLMPSRNFWKLLDALTDVSAMLDGKVVWSLPCRQRIGTIPLQVPLVQCAF